jgi:hypothetical protein
VALAFIPNPQALPHVNHIDCCTSNNFVENLEWVTHKQNMEHSARLGRMGKSSGAGDLCHASKLTESDVVQIKLRLMLGERICQIVRDYPAVKKGAIGEIKAGRSWGHVVVPDDLYREAMSRRAA